MWESFQENIDVLDNNKKKKQQIPTQKENSSQLRAFFNGPWMVDFFFIWRIVKRLVKYYGYAVRRMHTPNKRFIRSW